MKKNTAHPHIIGFNVETIKYKSIRFDCWDAGGQAKVRRIKIQFDVVKLKPILKKIVSKIVASLLSKFTGCYICR